MQFDGNYAPQPAHRALYDDRFDTFRQVYRQMNGIYRSMNS
jgi:hypothetical protein